MKELLRKTILCALALGGLMACNDDSATEALSSEEGYLTFSVAAADDVDYVITRAGSKITIASAAGDGYIAPLTADFLIEVRTDKDQDGIGDTGDDEKQLIYSGKVSDWNVATKLKMGYYVVTASLGDTAIGFNNHVFASDPKGVQFAIVGAQTTAVKIPVTLQNAIVRLKFTEKFKNYYSFEKLTLTQSVGTVEVSPTETRGAFVDATNFTLSGTFRSQGGAEKTFSKGYQASPATCHTITFDASNIGGNAIDITFDDTPTQTIQFDAELNPWPTENN